MNDREHLRNFGRKGSVDNFRPLVERYLSFVYSSAWRQVGEESRAAAVTRAVFLALARKAGKLPRKTVLADWLFRATRIACKRIGAAEHAHGMQIAHRLDSIIDQLPSKLRKAVLLRTVLRLSLEESMRILRTSERRVQKRAEKGLRRMARLLSKPGNPIEASMLELILAQENSSLSAPDGLATGILDNVERGKASTPPLPLVGGILRGLSWARWRRRLKIAGICLGVCGLLATAAGFYGAYLWRTGRLMAWFIILSSVHKAKAVPGLAQPARPWPEVGRKTQLNAGEIRDPTQFYNTTNIWLANLTFSATEWKRLEPKRVAPVPKILQPNGEVILRNTNAQRSGLSGVLGYDFNWARADLEFGQAACSNVRARFKGNGTYLLALYGEKRSFKVDLKNSDPQKQLGGVEEINFTNLIDDRSYMSDVLGYEFFRQAGVPAPRTAYVWLTLTVPGEWERKPLGLYALVENIGPAFAAERFGSKKTPVFKPVTYHLFEDLGQDWQAYAATYDLKTKATSAQKQRIIDFSQLLSHANNEEFAKQLSEFLDLDEFARFLASLVLLSSYDGFLSDGQNYYLYLDPGSNKFGFIPWDLDHAWGAFYLVGTSKERERASIWHPWVGQNRFLERVMEVEEFRQIYRKRLEEFMTTLFVPGKLSRRIDEIAQVIHDPIAAESTLRLEWFEQAVGDKAVAKPAGGDRTGPNRPVHQLKHFIEARSKSVREQLDGVNKGMIPGRGKG